MSDYLHRAENRIKELEAINAELVGELEYVKAYIEEREDWEGDRSILGDIDVYLAKAKEHGNVG